MEDKSKLQLTSVHTSCCKYPVLRPCFRSYTEVCPVGPLSQRHPKAENVCATPAGVPLCNLEAKPGQKMSGSPASCWKHEESAADTPWPDRAAEAEPKRRNLEGTTIVPSGFDDKNEVNAQAAVSRRAALRIRSSSCPRSLNIRLFSDNFVSASPL